MGRRYGTARALLIAAALTGPPALLIPLAAPGVGLAWPALGGLLIGLGVAIGNVVKGAFRQTYTPHHLLGRVTVSMHLLNYGTIPLAAVLAGAIGARYGVETAIVVMTAWLALTPLILLSGQSGGGGTCPPPRRRLECAATAAGDRPPSPARSYIGRTLSACGPFCPWVTSNSTFWPSLSSR